MSTDTLGKCYCGITKVPAKGGYQICLHCDHFSLCTTQRSTCAPCWKISRTCMFCKQFAGSVEEADKCEKSH